MPSSLDNYGDHPWLVYDNIYSVFTFETLHKLPLRISNLLKNCFVSFAGSATLCIKEDDCIRNTMFLICIWCMLQLSIAWFASIAKHFSVTAFCLDFSRVEMSPNFTVEQ